jgi:hypothetical protein
LGRATAKAGNVLPDEAERLALVPQTPVAFLFGLKNNSKLNKKLFKIIKIKI